MSEPARFFKEGVDATSVYRTMLNQSIAIAGLFVVPGLVFIGFWSVNGWPDFLGRPLLAAPLCAIVAGIWQCWGPVKNWRLRPIVRSNAIEAETIVQRDTSLGEIQKTIKYMRIPIGAETIVLVRSGAVILRYPGTEECRMIAIPPGDFVDEASRKAFLEMLRERGSQFTESLCPILFGIKTKSH